MSYAPLYGILGYAGNVLGGQLHQSQPGYTQQQLAQMQQQACMAQLSQAQLQFRQQALINACRPKSIFVPLTQDEVDMAEAMYEVNKIAPGLREEN